jgi:uncharacterized protein (TIGR04255 family)
MMDSAMETPVAAMKERLKLKNPPIIEAVIAIHVSELPGQTLENILAAAPSMLQNGYGEPKPLTNHSMEVKIEHGVSSLTGSDAIHGYRFFSVDQLYAVQFNRRGIVFSRLGSYDTWESFIGEARKVWSQYLAAVGAIELTAFQVRFINKIFIPSRTEITDYVQIYPSLPSDAPQEIQDMYMRLALRIAEPEGRLIHQQTFLPPERENYTALVLDNDFQFSALALTYESLWEEIEKVRDVKDDFFRKCVTPKMMESFNA